MASIILRQSNVISSPGATIKGTPLSNSEVDNNFANLNVQVSDLSNTVSTLVTSEISNGTSNVTITTANGPVRISTTLQPLVSNIYDLGSLSTRFGNVYLNGNLDINGSIISSDGSGNIFIGSTFVIDSTGNVLIGGDLAISSSGSYVGNIDISSAIGSGEITGDKIATGAVGSSQLASTGVSAATYGSSTQIPVISVDEDGRITSATNQGVVIGPGQLAASGVVAGRYGNAVNIPSFVVDEDGRITSASNVSVSFGGTTVSVLDNTTSSATFYPTLSSITSGNVSNVTVSTTKLYFVPSTGVLNATDFNSLSDATLKTNLQAIQNATNLIENINTFEFNWIDTNRKSAGVLAQQLENILPHLVTSNSDGLKSVNYGSLTAYLITCIKELSLRIKHLEDKNGS